MEYKNFIKLKIFTHFNQIMLMTGAMGIFSYSFFILLQKFNKPKQNKLQNEINSLSDKITKAFEKSNNIVKLIIEKQITIQEENITFTCNILSNIHLKPNFFTNKTTNPFLPPFEDGIFICELSNTHRLLFNKYSVVQMHVLVVSRYFQPQNIMITQEDIQATYLVMMALKGICFYNSGLEAGASQSHKHLQVIPEANLQNSVINMITSKLQYLKGNILQIPEFPFVHSIREIPRFKDEDDDKISLNKFVEIIHEIFIETMKDVHNENGQIPFNLLIKENWLMVVLRSKEKAYDQISLNGLCFTGNILVKDEKELKMIQMNNPIEILKNVCFQNQDEVENYKISQKIQEM